MYNIGKAKRSEKWTKRIKQKDTTNSLQYLHLTAIDKYHQSGNGADQTQNTLETPLSTERWKKVENGETLKIYITAHYTDSRGLI